MEGSGGSDTNNNKPKCKFTRYGDLKVEVVSGKDLVAKDVGGSSDPYCKFGLVCSRSENMAVAGHTTPVIQKTLNPTWNAPVTNHFTADAYAGFKLEVWDKDRFTEDDFMGEFFIPAEEIESWDRKPRFLKSFKLQPRETPTKKKKSKEEEVSGEITLALQFEFQRSYEELGVFRLREPAGLSAALDSGVCSNSDFARLITILDTDPAETKILLENGLIDRLAKHLEEVSKGTNVMKIIAALELLLRASVIGHSKAKQEEMKEVRHLGLKDFEKYDVLTRVLALRDHPAYAQNLDGNKVSETGNTNKSIKEAVANFVGHLAIFPKQDEVLFKVFRHAGVVQTILELIDKHIEENKILKQYFYAISSISRLGNMKNAEDKALAWELLERNKVLDRLLSLTSNDDIYEDEDLGLVPILCHIRNYLAKVGSHQGEVQKIDDLLVNDVISGRQSLEEISDYIEPLIAKTAPGLLAKLEALVNGGPVEDVEDFVALLSSMETVIVNSEGEDYEELVDAWLERNGGKVVEKLIENMKERDVMVGGYDWLELVSKKEKLRKVLWDANVSKFWNYMMEARRNTTSFDFLDSKAEILERFKGFPHGNGIEEMVKPPAPVYAANKRWFGPGKQYWLVNGKMDEEENTFETRFSFAGQATKTLKTYANWGKVKVLEPQGVKLHATIDNSSGSICFTGPLLDGYRQMGNYGSLIYIPESKCDASFLAGVDTS